MKTIAALVVILAGLRACAAQEQLPQVQTEGRLQFNTDISGNRMPDYAYCGYRASEEPLPQVSTRLRIEPSGRDDTLRLEEAIASLAAMPLDKAGWRGALQLGAGTFYVSGAIGLEQNGIVLRGMLDERGQSLTTIVATGQARRPLITMGSAKPMQWDDSQAIKLSLAAPIGLKDAGPVGPRRQALIPSWADDLIPCGIDFALDRCPGHEPISR